MSLLSLCMICKNEARYIKDALESVSSACDEILVVDSGSTDETLALLNDLKSSLSQIKVIERAWPGDFSSQKNFVLDQAKGPWILFLDADERLDTESAKVIRNLIKDSSADAFNIEILNYTTDFTEMGYQSAPEQNPYARGFVPTKLHRLFRKNPFVRYEGLIHERIEPSLERAHLQTLESPLIIHHLGKLKEEEWGLRSERYAFYEEIAARKCRDHPHDAQSHWELGVIYQKQAKFEQAEACFRMAHRLAPRSEDLEAYLGLILFQQAKWSELNEWQPKFKSNQFYVLLAKAQSDSMAVLELMKGFLHKPAQTSILVYELALKHELKEVKLETIELARKVSQDSGIVEWLQGQYERRKKNYDLAFFKLAESIQKGCSQALMEKLILLAELKRYPDVIAVFETSSARLREKLPAEVRKILALAKAMTERPNER